MTLNVVASAQQVRLVSSSICCFKMCLNLWQGEARLAFWCLSRQTLDPAILEEHMLHMLNAVTLGLATSNKWESMQCVQFGLKCISTFAKQVPAALQASAGLWLPLVWNLLLVQPVTDYEQVHMLDHSIKPLHLSCTFHHHAYAMLVLQLSCEQIDLNTPV